MTFKTPLSASRIKRLEVCSWDYWAGYHLKLPDKTNSGAVMGSCCHNLFEFLAEARHKKHYDNLVKNQNVKSCPSVDRYISSFLIKNGFPPKDKTVSAHGEEITHEALVESMLLEGLNYDFFCNKYGKPTKSFSEIDFDIDVKESDINYRVRGFIDKLFLFENKSLAIIRDFKSSKRMFEGKEVDDNIQHQIYELVITKLFPEYANIETEFFFMQYGKDGVLKVDKLEKQERLGLEYHLTHIQSIVDNFNEELALSNMAANKGWPSSYEGFSGLVKCGRAEDPKEKKKDGSIKWSCPQKWAKHYYVLLDESEKIIASSDFKKEISKPNKGQKIEKRFYSGCPAFRHLPYNRRIIAKETGEDFEEKEVDNASDLW